ncbi:hypothetical protein PIB30_073059 [Stylosanthes scabra]|uniref:Uncharacterized protein n=1 Tax=Stylosanthes scabra TaxID=79078 RepID=A0ABU6ZMX1_9FABA|nr:hypothetical protein [Stylosanthes scabra]
MTGVSKLLIQEFYANTAVLDEEVANAGQLPYKSFVRGVAVDFSSENIRRVMRFKAETLGAETLLGVIAQGLQGKGNLSFPSTIYKLCKDAGVPLREFRRTSKIPEDKLKIAKRMESTRIPRNVPPQQQENDDEDEQMPQAGGGNEEEEEEQQQHQHFQQPP